MTFFLYFRKKFFIFSVSPRQDTPSTNENQALVPTPTTLPRVTHYLPPEISPAPAYTIIFVGDSMTDALGPNFDALRPLLKTDLPDKVFGLFNYGFGSTNILSVDERLHHDTNYLGTELPAILSRDFDIIIIESMGHNPLSEYPLAEGLQKQTSALDSLVSQLAFFKPHSQIVFLATIAPSQQHYAQKTVDLSPSVRAQWANERRAYIENHINYAHSHNIPLIDVYHASLNADGTANLKYINHDDYIHPSVAGVELISQSIATYLDSNLPH
jgi:lysophospholipase L1-like esterase